jgi:pimeloyl-ACP methyl ester carboxylesterase
MKKILPFLIVATLSIFSCKKNDQAPPTYVIVHGAWSAPYAWQTVADELKAAGQNVVLVELPGHGTDLTSPATLSLDAYRDKVITAINATDGRIVLVGHSLAGMVISEVAEKIPSRIEKLIYIAAYLPANGQSLLALAGTDTTSLLGQSLRPTADSLNLDVIRSNISDIFIQDGTDATKQLVIANYRLEPAIPFTNKITLTAQNYGTVPKFYIHTLLDHAVTYKLQQRMLAATSVNAEYQLNTSHSPFLSKPDSVTALLMKIGQ